MDGFEILQKLGDGSYSIVYKVRRKADNNIYALKKVNLQKLKDKEKQNALNEVRILASIKSPFVISYKEAFIEDSDKSLCLVMEYADRGDLYQKIVQFKKNGCLIEETDVWRIFIQMTRGLKALHDLKILHRDLKSANIFLFSDGSAKIGDCNVSKVVYKGLGYTQTGTPYYASPEVWNDQPYDNKSDIWSLGCVTYEMLTLRPPFRANDMEGLYQKVIKGQFSKINSRYSNDIFEIIKFLLKVNPIDRPNCEQILKHPLVIKRIEFFKEQEGFKEEDFDEMDEGQLLKTLRITKNMLFLSEQLPNANYDSPKSNKNNNKTNKSSNNNNVTNNTNTTNKSSTKNNNSLPNITINSHYGGINEEKKNVNNEPSNKLLSKYKIINNGVNESINNNNSNNTSKKIDSIKNNYVTENKKNVIKTENTISSVNNSNNNTNIKKQNQKEENHSIERESNNKMPTHRVYQQKHGIVKKDKDFLKYLEGLGGGMLYSRYAQQIEGNKFKNKNRVNMYYKSSNKNNQYLPNIYKNKSNNSVNKYGIIRKK